MHHQKKIGKEKIASFTLETSPVQVEESFEFSLVTRTDWILTETRYFSKWVELFPTRQANDMVVIQFLEENILSKFSAPPQKKSTDNVEDLCGFKMISFYPKLNILVINSRHY